MLTVINPRLFMIRPLTTPRTSVRQRAGTGHFYLARTPTFEPSLDIVCSSFLDGMVASRLNGRLDASASPVTASSPSIVSVATSL